MSDFTVLAKLSSEVYLAVPSGRQKPSSESTADQFDDLAQERRRQERLKRKQLERREDGVDLDDDSESILDDQKRNKRHKKKKQRTELWSDDLFEDELKEELADAVGVRRKNRRKRDDDWLTEWDE